MTPNVIVEGILIFENRELCELMDIRIGQQPAAYKDLLLVAARQVLDRGVQALVTDIEDLVGLLAELWAPFRQDRKSKNHEEPFRAE